MQTKSFRWTAHLRPVALAGVLAAALLGASAERSMAAYTAQVKAGTLRITGDAASDKLALRLQPGVPGNLGAGDDEVRVDHSFGSFPDVLVTLNGGDGADRLRGGIGDETLLGGNGNDVVSGGDGGDTAMLGAGDDQYSWNPGDDNDRVEGQTGADVLEFNGSNVGEIIDISANGPRARLTRNVGSIAMDLDDLERIAVRALGGPDSITTGDLTGTDVTTVDVDLAALGGGGDLQVDSVIARGTEAADLVQVRPALPRILVTGLAAQTRITGSEPDVDQLHVQTLGGDDNVTVAPGVHSMIAPIVDLGADE